MTNLEELYRLAKVGGPLSLAMFFAIRWLVKEVRRKERDLRGEMKSANVRCEEQNALLASELRELRDTTIANNTKALERSADAIDRFFDRIGSGAHHRTDYHA